MIWMAWMGGSVAFGCGGTVCGGNSSTAGTGSTPMTPPATEDAVVQSGESIVFLQDDDEAWTALVQIQTEGAATEFGWVIPVPNRVDPEEVSIAPEGLMDDLEQATAPQFQTDGGRAAGDGGEPSDCSSGCTAPSVSTLVQKGADRLLSAVDLPGVAVVGPYEVASVGPSQIDALDLWFVEGGYNLPLNTWPIIDQYAADGFSFLIIRLLPLQGEGQGTVDTLRIPCGQAAPAIPLRLTAIAATSDMSITTYVVSNQRYAPAADWPEVAFDPSATDPTDPANDYVSRLQGALDRAGGRGFRTEFAGTVTSLGLPRASRDELGGGPYITRFRTWASPADMVTDPEFVPTGDTNDVSNVIDLRTASTRSGVGLFAPLLFGLLALLRRRADA